MDDRAFRKGATRRAAWGVVALAALASGCGAYVGTTAKSFLRHVRTNPDPNARYLAYAKLGSRDLYDSDHQREEAVSVLIERYQKGNEPLASRAMICRTLGELGDPRAREVLLKAVHSHDAVVKIEACRALGKVGLPEDASVLAQTMTLDNLEDARIAAIDGLADLKSEDPRIYRVLLDSMEHDDPAIRLASLNALRKIVGKDLGTEIDPWRKELEPILAATPADLAPPSNARSVADEVAAETAAANDLTGAPR
ncbi:HEAT repeat domain-containing protein [Paludisphaera sp.]|uniref:HEAT repeat domain-containing protein n=1 Tax=Paludisphaera sp. TaxID=2017432 RepID=UPI00301E23CB